MLEQYIKELSQALKKVGVVIIMIVFVAVLAKGVMQWYTIHSQFGDF